jgi:hypothetical protein
MASQTQSAPSPELQDRYGTAPTSIKRRKGLRVTWISLVLAVGVIVAYVAYQNLGVDSITGEQKTFDTISNTQVQVVFSVTRNDPSHAADCVIRARDFAGNEVGRREVYIKPATDTVLVTTYLTTGAYAVTGEVFGCSYTVPAYLIPASK